MRLFLVALTAVVASLAISIQSAGADEPTNLGAIWVAQANSIVAIDPDSAQEAFRVHFPFEVRALELDLSRDLVWYTGGGFLGAIHTDGVPFLEIYTGASSASKAVMAVHPQDGRVWLGVGKQLIAVDPTGVIVAQNQLGGNISAIDIHSGLERVYVAAKKEVLVFLHADGSELPGEKLQEPKQIDALAIDQLGRLWLTTSAGLRMDVLVGGGITVGPGDYGSIEVDLVGGVWAAGNSSVDHYAASGSLQWSVVPFQGVGNIDNQALERIGASLWVANQTSLAEIDLSGVVVRNVFFDPVLHIWDLATGADVTAPTVELVSPSDGDYLATELTEVVLTGIDIGSGIDLEQVEILVNGNLVAATCSDNDPEIVCVLDQPLGEGEYDLEVTVHDYYGNPSSPALAHVVVDLTPPLVTILEPADLLLTNNPAGVFLLGTVSEQADLDLGGVSIPVASDLSFNFAELNLDEGSNVLLVQAVDLAGNQGESSVTVLVDTIAPAPVDSGLVTVAIANGLTTVVGAPGSAEPGAIVVVTNAAGESVEATVAADGSFSLSIAADHGEVLTLVVRDLAGNLSAAVTMVVPGVAIVWSCNQPPDPADIAPAVDTTVSYDIFEASRFLWQSTPPVQIDVVAGSITAQRIILAKGAVSDVLGQPIPGVKVTIKGHREFGCTSTRADGAFDLAANGGGEIIVRFEQEGYFPVDRRLETLWRSYYFVDDVTMTPIPEQAHQVAMGVATAQFISTEPETDADGTRSTAFVIPAGTQAELRFADGSTQPVSSLSVRIKEYTVGDSGPEAMPASLPPTSGYTYAFEATADEALAAGAESVEFSQPLFHYVENFLNFPVGEPVPTGYYDRQAAAWVASDNGVVVRIVDIDSAGKAVLDFDDDGIAEPAEFLTSLGVTDEELSLVATEYVVGQTLWRVPIPHFTPWDCNWPYGPEPGAGPPAPDATSTDPKSDCPTNAADSEPGSIIDCQSQTLRERIPVAGTPYSLYYSSDTVPGKKANRTVKVRLIDQNTPASVDFIDVSVSIAGQRASQRFFLGSGVPVPEIWSYEWDGLDAFGQPVLGEVETTVVLAYGYLPVYRSSWRPGLWTTSSSSGSGGGGGGGGSSRLFGASSVSALIVGDSRTSAHIVLRRTYKGRLRNFDGRYLGLGGWKLDAGHFLDRDTHTVALGNGRFRQAQKNSTQAIVVEQAPATVFVWDTDTWVPQASSFLTASEIETQKNGELLFVNGGNRVYKKTLAGDYYNIVGNGLSLRLEGGRYHFDHDGQPATDVPIGSPISSLLEASDGTLYLASATASFVFKVTPDGLIHLVAGNGDKNDYSGDNGLATEAGIGELLGLTIGPDNGLYIFHHRKLPSSVGGARSLVIRRVDLATNLITTHMGGGLIGCRDPALSLEGRNAEDACVFQSTGFRQLGGGDIAFDTDGGLLFPHRAIGDESFIWRVSPVGVLERFAGIGSKGISGDGGLARDAEINNPVGVERYGDSFLIVSGFISQGRTRAVSSEGIISTFLKEPKVIAISPDPSGKFVHYHHSSPRREVIGLASKYPFANGEIRVGSQDGSESQVYDFSGRHQRTINGLTGAPLVSFVYDVEGELASASDRDGDSLTVARSGSTTELTAPDGAKTVLIEDANGYATSIINPAGETWNFVYTADGLMTSMLTPRNGQWIFEYDGQGYLTRDQDAEGGEKTLDRVEIDRNNYSVDLSTAEGRTTHYDVELSSNESAVNSKTTGSQTESRDLDHRGGGTITAPDGTRFSRTMAPDPRFAWASPYPLDALIQTPSGLASQRQVSRTAAFAATTGELPFNEFTETVTLNGRATVSHYNRFTETVTTTSPEGRVVTTQLNAQGRVASIQVPGVAPVIFSYNPQGRLDSVSSSADGETRSSSFGYSNDGFLASATDPLSRTTGWNRDPVGRSTHQTTADGRVIGFGYDANGNPTSLTPPGKPAHSFDYSLVDQPTSYTPPGALAATYSYDLDRRLTDVTFPAGGLVQMSYDNEDRLLGIDSADDDLVFTYVPGTSNIATVNRSNGQATAYTYDGFLPLSQTWSGEISGSVDYQYDSDFRVSRLTVNGASAVYGYDGDSLLTEVGSLAIARDPANGQMTGTTLDTVTTSWAYNGFGEPTDVSASDGTSTLFREEMTRDKLGRVTQKQETHASTTVTTDYEYDLTGRLLWVDVGGNRQVTYTYDSNDNRLTEVTSSGTTSATYDDQDRLLTYGNTSYTWNDDGDLVSKTTGTATSTYDYDVFGNLITYNDSSLAIDYIIDGQNRRVGKKINGALVQGFLYGDQLNPVAEVDGTGSVVSTFVYGTRPNTPDYLVKGLTTYRVISDHIGSVRMVVDSATGALAQRLDYNAFGKVTFDSNPGFQPFGFAGGIYDRHTGLTRFGARDYEPETGRWTARDPILFGGGDTNLYRYAAGDPVNYVDPDGLLPFDKNGREALDWYAQIIIDDDSSPLQVAGAWVGAIFSAMWTPCTSGRTVGALSIGFPVGKWLGRPFWRYIGPRSGPAGRWLTRGLGWRAPFGRNFKQASDALQLPNRATDVVRAPVKWWQPVRGPRTVTGNPQFGRGGGVEYYKGPQWP